MTIMLTDRKFTSQAAETNNKKSDGNTPLADRKFMKLAPKFEAIYDPRSGVRLINEPNKPPKRTNEGCLSFFGTAFPTYKRIVDGAIPQLRTVTTVIGHLASRTTLRSAATLELFSDDTSFDEFCDVIGAPDEVCDSIRLKLDHPLADFGMAGNGAYPFTKAQSELDAMQGVYQFHRLGEDAKGRQVVVQGGIQVRSVVEHEGHPQLCSVLTTPNVDGGFFSYFGVHAARGDHRYWIFNQDSPLNRDFIFMVTASFDANKSPKRQRGTVVTMRQSHEMEPIRSRIHIEKVPLGRSDAEHSKTIQFMRRLPTFTPLNKFRNKALLRWLQL